MKTTHKRVDDRPQAIVYELPDHNAMVGLRWRDGMEKVVSTGSYKGACKNYRVWARHMVCLPFKE